MKIEGFTVPDRYCSYHGLKMAPVKQGISFDGETGMPKLISIKFKCPKRLSHFLQYDESSLFYSDYFNEKYFGRLKDNCHTGGL